MLLLKDVYFHWHFVKLTPSTSFVIDLALLIREPAVARTRGRPMESIVQLPSQEDMEDATTETEPVSLIQRQKNAFIQRNSSHLEITKNIVPERQLVFTKNWVADRARGRGRGRGRGQARQGRAIRGEGSRWIKTLELTNQEADQVADEVATE